MGARSADLSFGTARADLLGAWWLPDVPAPVRFSRPRRRRLGIAGDLFESMLKAQRRRERQLVAIPGHGGVLDRIDALLFAAPVYYVVLKYVGPRCGRM